MSPLFVAILVLKFILKLRFPTTEIFNLIIIIHIWWWFFTSAYSQVDLVEIKQSFLQKYHKTLYKMIEGDCSGDYKKLLLALVKMN